MMTQLEYIEHLEAAVGAHRDLLHEILLEAQRLTDEEGMDVRHSGKLLLLAVPKILDLPGTLQHVAIIEGVNDQEAEGD